MSCSVKIKQSYGQNVGRQVKNDIDKKGLTGSPFSAEKRFHQFRAFIGHNAFGDLCFGMKGELVAGYPLMPVLVVGRPPDDPADLAPVQGTRAHQAGLNCNVEAGIRQVFRPEEVESRGKGDHFRMCRGVIQLFHHIMPASDDPVVQYHHRAYGYLFFLKSEHGLFQGLLHEVIIRKHRWMRFVSFISRMVRGRKV